MVHLEIILQLLLGWRLIWAKMTELNVPFQTVRVELDKNEITQISGINNYWIVCRAQWEWVNYLREMKEGYKNIFPFNSHFNGVA